MASCSRTAAAEHEIVAFGIDAHREMGWFTILVLGILRALSARGPHGLGARHHIGNLKGQAGPSALAFATAVDGDESAGDLHLGNMRILAHDGGAEEFAVESRGPHRIGRPDRVFEFFDGNHRPIITPDGRRNKRGSTARGDGGSCPQVSGFALRGPGDLTGNKKQPDVKKTLHALNNVMRLSLNHNKTMFSHFKVLTISVTILFTAFCELSEASRRFTYVYEASTAHKGEVEVENWVTWKSGPADKNGFDFRHELEFGVTDRFQLALYAADWSVTDNVSNYQGTGLEGIYQLTDPKTSFLGSALYGEVMLGDQQFKLETKAIVQKNIGAVVLAYNATLEAEWEGENLGALDERYGKLEQSAGASYKFSPHFKAGGEFMQRCYLADWSVPTQSVIYAGPNVALEFGRYFATVTAMIQATAISGQPDLQLRTIFGVEF